MLYDLLQEMQTWFTIPTETLEKAKNAKLSKGHENLVIDLTASWLEGHYDEDPQSLYNQLIDITNNY